MWSPLSAADPRTCGGKARALQRLALVGLPVPSAWVVPVEAFRAFLLANGWSGHEPDLAARIPGGALPPALQAALTAWVARRPPRWLAVRSSGLDEDGEARSAAGQYSSILGVRPEGVAAAIRACWASFHTEHARQYRMGHAGEPWEMAVVVQELVDARAAGVLFTMDPLDGSSRVMRVEAIWGVGEGLVSGRVVPDRYRLARPRYLPRRLVGLQPKALWRLTVEEAEVSPQAEEEGLGPAGLERRPVEAPLARKLGEAELHALGRVGLAAEAAFGGPQDVEWAIDRGGQVRVLQARPITAHTRLPRGGQTLWTRRFFGERWPSGATPLSWSFFEPILRWFIAYPQTNARLLGGDPPFRIVRGHPYLNATVFRHLAFKLPGFPPPQFMLEFFPPEEEHAWVSRAAAPPDARVYAAILAETWAEQRWQRFRWNPLTNPRAWDAFLAALDPRLDALAAAPPERLLAEAESLVKDYLKIHITSLLFANLLYQILSPRLSPAARALLLSPPEGSVTVRLHRELWQLAHGQRPLDAVIAQHGHRAEASWEIFSRRWAEDPAMVTALAALLRGRPDPAAGTPQAEAARAEELRRLSRPLREAVHLTRRYLALREAQRYHFERALAVLKQRLLGLGARWFDAPEDVRLLTTGDLQSLLTHPRTPEDARAFARARAAAAAPPAADPPDFLHGDQAWAAALPAHGRAQGLGVSPGVAEGPARVARTLQEATQLQPGEILVAPSLDPSWTPLFARAAGVVLEMGSQLSHGAVVAREYGVPAVANIRGATALFSTGTRLTIDGRSGSVWRHD